MDRQIILYEEVLKLTDKSITAVATHIHWEHIGGHKYFPDFYAHAEEPAWLNGYFPLLIDLGGREIEVLHTPGHTPGHLCFWEKSKGYLFTGDLVYRDILFAYYPSTDPAAYLDSLEKVAALPVKRVFPAHHSLDIQPEILTRMREAFRNLKAEGKLHHGSGTFDYVNWGVWL